jgi:hypothetical protein
VRGRSIREVFRQFCVPLLYLTLIIVGAATLISDEAGFILGSRGDARDNLHVTVDLLIFLRRRRTLPLDSAKVNYIHERPKG